jgi:hypothetical protein
MRRLLMGTLHLQLTLVRRVLGFDFRSILVAFTGTAISHVASYLLTMTRLDSAINAEMKRIFEQLQRCLDLRDKYISISLQRIGDNPRDHDGVFHGFANPSDAGVTGARSDLETEPIAMAESSEFKKWRIYPRPPPPHWHWTDTHHAEHHEPGEVGEEEFDFDACNIPGEHEWSFKIDDHGVYQVYEDKAGELTFSRVFGKSLTQSRGSEALVHCTYPKGVFH